MGIRLEETTTLGAALLRTGRGAKCYKKEEVVEVYWVKVNKVEPPLEEMTAIIELEAKLWNGDVEGAWRRDKGDVDYDYKFNGCRH